MDVVVIKLGSSVLADGTGALRDLSVRVAEICALRAVGIQPVLVSSGAVACGVGALGLAGRPEALAGLQATAAVGQGVLIAHYRAWCQPHGMIPAQVLLTADDLARDIARANALATLRQLLAWGCLPVINENDTTATGELTFGDNDLLAAGVAALIGARLLVVLGDQPGIIAPDGTVMSQITGDPRRVAHAEIAGAGRGGIASKLQALAIARGAGICAVVASGHADGVIPALVRGDAVGTWCHPVG